MPNKTAYLTYLQTPTIKAWLDTISWAEGAGYNTLFGGKTFANYNKHPNLCIPYKNTCSTAAGKYQFLNNTWQGIANKLGLTDFSPTNQDIAALELTSQRGALSYILKGDIIGALKTLGCAWASLPYSGCGQNQKGLTQVVNYYNARLRSYGGNAASDSPMIDSLPEIATGTVIENKAGAATAVTLALVVLGAVVLTR